MFAPFGPSAAELLQLAQDAAAAWQGSAAGLTVAPVLSPIPSTPVGPPHASGFAATSAGF